MTFSSTERAFILEWANLWCHLVNLIYDCLRTDEVFKSHKLPHELVKISYQNLRSWFVDKETSFLALWKDFYTSRDWNLDINSDLVEEIKNPEKVLQNPFFCWYGL